MLGLWLVARVQLRLELGVWKRDAWGYRLTRKLALRAKRRLQQTRRAAAHTLDPVRRRSRAWLVGDGVENVGGPAALRGTRDDRVEHTPKARDLPDKPPPRLHCVTRVAASRIPASGSRLRSRG
jgi:hypothetical protein